MQKLKHTVYKYKHIINKRWQCIARHVLIFWLLWVLIKMTIPKHYSQLKQSQIRWFGNSDISWSEFIFNEDKHQLTWWQVTQAYQIPEQHLAVFLVGWVKSPTLSGFHCFISMLIKIISKTAQRPWGNKEGRWCGSKASKNIFKCRRCS